MVTTTEREKLKEKARKAEQVRAEMIYQAKCFDEYNKLLAEEPEYTLIPKEYWVNNPRVPTYEYVKEKLKFSDSEKLTIPDLFKACVQFPEIAAYHMMGIHLRPYQHFDLDQTYQNRYIAKACSRRLGKTFANRITLLHTSRFNLLPSEMTGTTWNVVLQDQDVANDLYIEPLHEMCEKADTVTYRNFKGTLGRNFWTSAILTPRDKVGKVRVNKISFRVPDMPEVNVTGGISRITTFPPTKKVIGREGNLMGDEVSKWKDNPKCKDEFKFYDQLIAILKDNPKFKGIFASTPEGEEDVFATEIFDPNNKNQTNRYKKLWLPYWVRQDQNWLREILDTESQSIRSRRRHLFMQEYEAKFITISNPFFHPELATKCMVPNWRKNRSTLPCSLGLDWGGSMSSETAWAIFEWDLKADSKRKLIAKKSYQVGEDLKYLENDLLDIKRNYNVKWVTPDNKGGRWMMPRLEQIFGAGRVNPLNFTTDKKAGYEKLRQAMEDEKVLIGNDTKLFKQILGLTEDLKPSSAKGKDDEIDAVMMALYPIYNQKPKIFKVLRY